MGDNQDNPTKRYLDSLGPSARAAAIAGLRTLMETMTRSRRRVDVTEFPWHQLSQKEIDVLYTVLVAFYPRRRGQGSMLLIIRRALRRIRQIAAESASQKVGQ